MEPSQIPEPIIHKISPAYLGFPNDDKKHPEPAMSTANPIHANAFAKMLKM
jgi:hypothetical protein